MVTFFVALPSLPDHSDFILLADVLFLRPRICSFFRLSFRETMQRHLIFLDEEGDTVRVQIKKKKKKVNYGKKLGVKLIKANVL